MQRPDGHARQRRKLLRQVHFKILRYDVTSGSTLSTMKLLRDMSNTAVLLIDCPDRKGLVATVSGLLYRYGANILHADQHQDREAGLFFMRVEWSLDDFDLDAFGVEFEGIAVELQM